MRDLGAPFLLSLSFFFFFLNLIKMFFFFFNYDKFQPTQCSFEGYEI